MEKNTIKTLRGISTKHSLLLLLVVCILAGIPVLLRQGADVFYGNAFLRDRHFLFILQNTLTFLIGIPLLLLLYYKKINRSLSFGAVFVKPQRSKGWIFKWLLIALGVSKAVGIVFRVVLSRWGITGKTGFINAKNDALGYSLYLISAVVIAPIVEELLFRATICRGIRGYGELFAAVMSGIMFGLYHLNIDQLFFAAAFGIIAGMVFAKCRSIFVVMLFHAVNNLLVTLYTISWRQIGGIFNSKDVEFVLHALFVKHLFATTIWIVTVVLSGVVLVAGLILAVIEIVRRKGKSGLANPLSGCTAVKKTLIFFSSPVTVITFIIMICLVIVSATIGTDALL